MTSTGIVLSLLLALLLPRGLSGQSTEQRFSIGVAAGYQQGSVSGTFPVFNGSPSCGVFDGGVEASLRTGPILMFPDLIGRGVGLRTGLFFSRRTESFVAVPVDPQRVRDPQAGTIVEVEREYRHTSFFNQLELELLGTGRIGNRLHWFAGPVLWYQASASFEQYDHITGPEGFLFEDGEVRHTMEDRYPLVPRNIGFGALLGTGYRLPISERVDMQPELNVRITSPGGVVDFPRTTVGAELRLALLYSLPPPPEPPPLLSATLDLFCVDRNLLRSDTAELVLSEITEETILFLPSEISDEGDGSTGGYHILSRHQADSFRADMVPGRPESVRYDLLNIIGRRLRENPGAELILSGPGGAGSRREGCISYLHNVWSISPERIVLDSSGATLAGDHNEIRWRLTPEQLNAPLRADRVLFEHGYPTIRLSPRIVADAGVQSWSITIAQGDRVLARYSRERETRDPDGIPWEAIATGAEGRVEPLIATLSVLDSANRRATANDTLPVTLAPESSRSGYRRVVSIPLQPGAIAEEMFREDLGRGMTGLPHLRSVTLSIPQEEKFMELDERSLIGIVRQILSESGISSIVIRETERHEGEDVRVVFEAD